MNKETAKEILSKQYDKTFGSHYEQSALCSIYEKVIIEAMIEYAKAKVEERDNLLQDYADEIGNEIAVQIVIEKAKTPDFK